MDGRSPIQGTPIRNILYFDDTGTLYGDIEVDGRFFIHSILVDPYKVSNIKHYRDILAELETRLKEKGLTEYYTMAADANGFRFNELMGFKTAYEVWNDEFEVMVKEL